ncbi:MAG: ClC family H(+)/Cl(-) exchange transporter [Clostridiales Family XIII bacterium]|jgi:H+/Cl- antiporter ClcA|nr:ClC family H(+)/Cl(-) exchange transporter [Clostridiales Family XIII bacterium]
MKRNSNNNHRNAIRLEEMRVSLVLKSLLVGACTGGCVAAYRWLLMGIESGLDAVYEGLRAEPGRLPLWALATAGIGLAVGAIAAKNRMASGSGIPQVTGLIRGYFRYDWLRVLLAKFFGGALAFCAGAALGREGPSIQMGACIADGLGGGIASSRTERKVLIAGGASAGLAAAFGAPLAGVLFAFEEIFRYLSPALLLATTVAAMSADYVTNWVFGMEPVFDIPVPEALPLRLYGLLIALGVLLGVFGAVYNRALIGVQQGYAGLWRRLCLLPVAASARRARAGMTRLSAFLAWCKPAPVFLLALPIGMLLPAALGSGTAALGQIGPAAGLGLLAALLLVRFAFSVTSFASGSPGGIFLPLLILGALVGGLFATACVQLFGVDPVFYNNFVVMAMAGAFAAIVRAPITGIVLLTEMTGSFTHLLPITVVSICAYVTAEVLKSAPVYESLLKGFLGGAAKDGGDGGGDGGGDSGAHIMLQAVVHLGSRAAGRAVKDLSLPQGCLLVAVTRGGRDIVPSGATVLRESDRVLILCDRSKEAKLRRALDETFC